MVEQPLELDGHPAWGPGGDGAPSERVWVWGGRAGVGECCAGVVWGVRDGKGAA